MLNIFLQKSIRFAIMKATMIDYNDNVMKMDQNCSYTIWSLI